VCDVRLPLSYRTLQRAGEAGHLDTACQARTENVRLYRSRLARLQIGGPRARPARTPIDALARHSP